VGDDRAAPGPKQFSASDCRSVRPSTVYSSNDVKFERNLFSVCGCSNSDMEHFLEHLCGWKYTYARRFCSDIHIHTHTYICMCIYICMYVYMYVCMYVCMYVYIVPK